MSSSSRFRICLLIVAFLCTLHTAQLLAQTLTIQGKILNAETGEPLRGARVFLAETTFGAISRQDGTFTLRNIPVGNYNLVASSLGYTIHKQVFPFSPAEAKANIIKEQILTVRLVPKPVQLKNVEVTANRENGVDCSDFAERLLTVLLGTTPNARQTVIVNKDVLHCRVEKAADGKQIIRFTADEALILENYALGYRVRYYPEDIGFYRYFDAETSRSEWFTGAMEFEELSPKDSIERRTWERRREETFTSSFRHFLQSVFNGSWQNAGFGVTAVDYPDTYLRGKGPGGKTPMDTLLLAPVRSGTKRLQLPGAIEVIAQKGQPAEIEFINHAQSMVFAKSRQRSSLLVPQSFSVDIQQQGILKRPTDITLYGYWSWQRLADELPLNYTLPKRDTSSVQSRNTHTPDSLVLQNLLHSGIAAYKAKQMKNTVSIMDSVIALAPNINNGEAYFYRGLALLGLAENKTGCADCMVAQLLGYADAEQAVRLLCKQYSSRGSKDSLRNYKTKEVVVESQTAQSRDAWSNLRALVPHIRYTAAQAGALSPRHTATVIDPTTVDSIAVTREQELALTDYDCQISLIKTSRASRLSLQCIGKLIQDLARETSDAELKASAKRIVYLIRDIHHAESQNKVTLIVYLRAELADFVNRLM